MRTINWLGLDADYDEDELAEMASLRSSGDVVALRVIHRLKAYLPGTRLLREPKKSRRRVRIPEVVEPPEGAASWGLDPDWRQTSMFA